MKKKLLLVLSIIFSSITYSQIEFQEKIIVDESYTTRNAIISQTSDIDGDGDIDIITSGFDLNWYENIDGKGSFGIKKTIFKNFKANSLYAIDYDMDGDMDIITTKSYNIYVFENIDGNGDFNLKTTITRNGRDGKNSYIHIIDIDGDNDKDIISSYVGLYSSSPYTRTNIVWHENIGGNFSTENIISTINVSKNIESIYAEDLDGDGDMDIISAFYDDNKISWFENIDSNFGSEIIITTTVEGVKSVLAHDMDNDGDIDIISASENDNKIAWYKNIDGSGTFGPQQIITTNALSVQSIYIADFNKDSNLDIISAASKEVGSFEPSLNSKVSLYENTGNDGVFNPEKVITLNAFGAKHIIADDLNGDGFLDIISTSKDDNKVAWYKNIGGTSNFTNQITISRIVQDPQTIFAADLDGDMDIDILSVSSDDNKVAWYENINGNGLFGNQKVITENVTRNTSAPSAFPTDIDNDGDIDIIASIPIDNNSTTKLVWFENVEGKGDFKTEHLITEKIESYFHYPFINSYDLDMDGDMDIVYQDSNTQSIVWYENMDGKGSFNTSKNISGSGSNALFTGSDLDSDGDIDILTSDSRYKIKWFENTDGKGSFATEHSFSADETGSVHSADIDGDNDMDIIAVSPNGYGDNSVSWYENIDGKGNFNTEHSISTVRIWGESIFPCDIDGDGDIDVLTASGHSSINGTLAWYENINGKGVFSEQQIISETDNQSIGKHVYAADIDGDNDLDIICAYSYSYNSYFSKIAWYQNNTNSLRVLDQDQLLNLHVYPNPTTGVFNIKSKTQTYQIQIFTTLGQLVYKSMNPNQIDISFLEQGLYLCRILSKNGNLETIKIIKK